jgi:ribose transport system substrate-binding protein
MVASSIVLAVAGVKGETVGNLYHTPSRVIIGADLVVEENAKNFYFPTSAY